VRLSAEERAEKETEQEHAQHLPRQQKHFLNSEFFGLNLLTAHARKSEAGALEALPFLNQSQ